MYFAQQYEWSAALNFHGSILLEIERGLVQWGDSFLHLESRTLYKHPLQEKSPTSSSSEAVLFCRDYQQEQCISVKDHFGFICGERKWLKHIYVACWTRLRKQVTSGEFFWLSFKSSGCERFIGDAKKLDSFSSPSLHGPEAGGMPVLDFDCSSRHYSWLFIARLFSCETFRFWPDNVFVSQF